jgi:arylsulfatase A-like enzyme
MFSAEPYSFNKKLPEGTITTPSKLSSMADVKQLFDGYDLGIRRVDDHIGMLIDALKKEGVYGDLIIIISSDHGENFGELGIYAEHGTADQATTRIPLIIRWPGKISKHSDYGFHYNLDLLPTLAEIFCLEMNPNWDGKSFAKSLLNGVDLGYDYLVLSQCAHVCQRSVRFENWIYIRTYHDGFHLLPKEMLFDLFNDPFEQFNLASSHQEVCLQAVYYLNEWHDHMMKTMSSSVDPLWIVINEGGPYHAKGVLKQYVESLVGTDRRWAIDEYKMRHSNEF